jgi:hypothetical protein
VLLDLQPSTPTGAWKHAVSRPGRSAPLLTAVCLGPLIGARPRGTRLAAYPPSP